MELPLGLAPGGRIDEWRPAPPRLVVADVDGTLVGPQALMTPPVVAAIRRADEAGMRFGFATGRMRLAVEPLWEQVRSPGPHVIENGAQVRCDGRTIAKWPLDPDHLDAVLDLCGRAGLYAEVYVEDGYYVTDRDPRAEPHWDLLGRPPIDTVDALPDGAEVFKCTLALFNGTGDPDGIEDELRRAGLEAGGAGSPRTPDIHYVNANHPDADKGRALAAGASHVGVELNAVVAIGDGNNDRSMFEVAGTAIAMGQASSRLKAAAHLVAPHVDDDGAAAVLAACLTWMDTD